MKMKKHFLFEVIQIAILILLLVLSISFYKTKKANDQTGYSSVVEYQESVQARVNSIFDASKEEISKVSLFFIQFQDGDFSSGFEMVNSTKLISNNIAFIDYNCSFCRNDYPRLKQFLSEQPGQKLYIVMTPILGRESEEISRRLYCSDSIGFLKNHEALMQGVHSDFLNQTMDLTCMKNQEFSDILRMKDIFYVTATPTYILSGKVVHESLTEYLK